MRRCYREHPCVPGGDAGSGRFAPGRAGGQHRTRMRGELLDGALDAQARCVAVPDDLGIGVSNEYVVSVAGESSRHGPADRCAAQHDIAHGGNVTRLPAARFRGDVRQTVGKCYET